MDDPDSDYEYLIERGVITVKIKEQDEQHIAFGSTLGENLLLGILGFGLFSSFIIIGAIIPNIPITIILSVVGIAGIYFMLHAIIGPRIVLDKPTKTVTISYRSFLFARRQHDIPFSDVRSVVIDYEENTGQDVTQSNDTWEVSLDIGKKLRIDSTGNKADMLYLANNIGRFIGIELEDKSAKPKDSSTGLFRKVKAFFRKGGNLTAD